MRRFLTSTLILILAPLNLAIAAPVSGKTTTFQSPNGLSEQCIRIAEMPGAHYSRHDLNEEQEFCKLDMYQLALCPKLWSTSPGTILHEISGADFSVWERENCPKGHHARDASLRKPASFKMSVNGRETSATYAPSSWIYYHFSRYFRTGVHIPVAVYRSMDSQVHQARVVKPALDLTGNRRSMRMLAEGWKYLEEVETGEAAAGATAALMTDNGRQVFGVLLDNKGERYDAEFNGTRESGWGSGQNHDFQQTAPFLALRNALPVNEAASAAIVEARANERMAKALPADTSVEQVIFWMNDVIEITLLDYLLGQQDRIGNIDFNWRWFWVENGELETKSAKGNEIPSEISKFNPLRLKQSAINDNDAGVRPGYANFTEKTGMLDGLRHYNPGLYKRLARLSQDLQSEGDVYQWLIGEAGLNEREADAISRRALSAFSILQADCESGTLTLDLEPARYLPGGDVLAPTDSTCGSN